MKRYLIGVLFLLAACTKPTWADKTKELEQLIIAYNSGVDLPDSVKQSTAACAAPKLTQLADYLECEVSDGPLFLTLNKCFSANNVVPAAGEIIQACLQEALAVEEVQPT